MIPLPSATAAPDDDQLLQLRRLRFDAPLEQQFRAAYEAQALAPRLTIMLLSLVLVAVTPLYDRWLLAPPEAFVSLSRWLQFGVQIPAIVLAALCTLVPKLQRWSAASAILAALVVSAGLIAQHIIGARMDFTVPPVFSPLAVAAVLMLGRIPFRTMLPWTFAAMLGTTTAQVVMLGQPTYYNAIASWMMFVIVAVTAYLLEFGTRQSWYRGRLLEFLATRDSLTGLPNRRHFDTELLKLVREAQRNGSGVALMLLDVDLFKHFNDRHGHPAGDQCLRIVGEWLGSAMRRPQDFCARVGGEEFAAVWYGAPPDDAIRLASALREGVDQLAAARGLDDSHAVTASGGFAHSASAAPGLSAEQIAADLVKQADLALYAAKRNGRARLVVADRDHLRDLAATAALAS